MISLLLDNVSIGFDEAKTPDGQPVKIMVVLDQQSGIQVRLPLGADVAHQIAAFLDDRPVVEIARVVPKGP